MVKALKNLFKGRKTRSLEAQVSELRVAVASLLAEFKTSDGSDQARNDIDAVLVHAAAARVEVERLSGLYESALARVALMEENLSALEQKIAVRA
ncbi:MAG: hypothetical protein Q7T44_03860 [Parvibaculum sp.]|nr:hypothetical protein [Parvibaculum sp.]